MAADAVSLRKSHEIVILSLCNIVKGQAKYNQIPSKYVHIKVTIILDYCIKQAGGELKLCTCTDALDQLSLAC